MEKAGKIAGKVLKWCFYAIVVLILFGLIRWIVKAIRGND